MNKINHPDSALKGISLAVANCHSLKPENLIISELKWRYLIRSGLRGKNILILGPKGCGKTLAAQSAIKALGREENQYTINLGSTQDPRASLIGNTHFSKSTGTYFDSSAFVKAITTPDCVILLDELSRANPEASNILMSVLDELQRYLRLDEKGGEIVKVAPGVTFIATANVGNEYTGTRVMDRALLDRFQVKIEMDSLTATEEIDLIKMVYSSVDNEMISTICGISESTRTLEKSGNLSNSISTRAVMEMAGLSADGFSLLEIADAVIYPDFPDDGGVTSERTLVKQIVQKFITSPANNGQPPF
jgi:MoxR-like ATPase